MAHRISPVLSHPAGRGPLLAALLLALALVVTAATLAGALAIGERGGLLAVPWLAWALALGGLWRFWQRQVPRELAFDGQGWRVSEAGQPDRAATRAQVALDGQSGLLLRLDGVGAAPLWLWLQRGPAPADAAHWHLLRCAIYSRALAAAPAVPR